LTRNPEKTPNRSGREVVTAQKCDNWVTTSQIEPQQERA